MARIWTENQQDAIDARRGTVLVAAAAGSGKTAVLVERALKRMTDPENPTPADRLLIVTFTKAAAAEMRARLERRLREMLREDPGSALLRRQSVLLSQAHIGTVDSFCAELVREFFHELDVAADFKILSDKQKEDITWEALNQVMESSFEEESFLALADAFSGERSDRKLMEIVLRLYGFMQSHPFPRRWLEEKVKLYEASVPFEKTPWGEVILNHVRQTAEYCLQVGERALRELLEENEEFKKAFLPVFLADKDLCEKVYDLACGGDWDGLYKLLSRLSFQRRGALKGYEEDVEKERLELFREEIKGSLQDLCELIASDSAQSTRELQETAPLISGLSQLTLAFSQRYEAKKRELGFLDYSDLEHLAIRLFLTEEGKPTPIAQEVSLRFEEIMIDEYQDVNEVQDSLFRAISRQENNLFMVGDVKQSIYGFRRAMPEIFLGRRGSFQKYDRTFDRYPAYLVLDRNFRSRSTVTGTVNFVFSRLMSKEAGDIEYTGEEKLVCGAEYGEKDGCETELVFLEREREIPAEEAESAYLAGKIREMLQNGFTVTDGGEERPAHYGDFCILLRSANQYAHSYARALQKLGIPAKASASGGFFAAAEIAVMLSFLRVIDNPNQDIPLLSVLMSPIYGFTAQETAELRLSDRERSLYLTLCEAAKENARCLKVLEDLRKYRAVCSTLSCDAFLGLFYQQTGYPDIVLSMDAGEERLANLHLLRQYARDFEASGFHGISGFVRFLDRLRENRSDLEAAQPAVGEEKTVQVMSIHKSKGLEFPVCILAGCGRNFVQERSDVLLHPELGLGIKLRSKELPVRSTTAAREAIALSTEKSEAAEELRVLYVAMTRAREKLILVTSGTGLEKTLLRLSCEITQDRPAPHAVRSVKNAGQWLMLCALSHPDGKELRERVRARELPLCTEDGASWKVSFETVRAACREEREEVGKEIPAQADQELLERLRKKVEFRYPGEEELIVPAKVSASRLTAGKEEVRLSRPAWLGEQGMTPTERGIALHDFMQYADFSLAAKDPEKELARLTKERFLTPEQGGAVDLKRVKRFFESPLGKRTLCAKELQKERRFTAVIPAYMAGGPRESEAPVILQGAVDCTFLDETGLHIIDFKTDRIKSAEELWERYGIQIRLYAYAMEQVTGQKVGELFFYSTYLSEESGRSYEGEKLREEF